jgi:hypothetical protein
VNTRISVLERQVGELARWADAKDDMGCHDYAKATGQTAGLEIDYYVQGTLMFTVSSSRRVNSLLVFQTIQHDRCWARQEARS